MPVTSVTGLFGYLDYFPYSLVWLWTINLSFANMTVSVHSCFMRNEIRAKYSLNRQTGNLGMCTQMVLTSTNIFEKIGYESKLMEFYHIIKLAVQLPRSAVL